MPPKSAPSFLLTRISDTKRRSLAFALIPDSIISSVSRTRPHQHQHTQTRLQSTNTNTKTNSDSSSRQTTRTSTSLSSANGHESRAHNRPVFSRGKLAAFAAEGDLLTSPSRGVPPIRTTSSTGAGPSVGSSGLRDGRHQVSSQNHQGLQPSLTRSTLPKPVLKTNPYAANYAVSEADLAEPSDVPPPPSSQDAPATKLSGRSRSSQSSGQHDAGPSSSASKRRDGSNKPMQATDAIGGGRHHRRRPVVRRIYGLRRDETGTSEAEPRKHQWSLGPPTKTRLSASYKDRIVDALKPERIDLKSDRPESVTVHQGYILFTDLQQRTETAISLVRLRDACTCKMCQDPSTKQKLITTGQAMREATAAQPIISLSQYPSPSHHSFLSVTWKPTPETQHVQHVPVWKLRALADRLQGDGMYTKPHFQRKLWDNETITQSPSLRIPFSEVSTQSPRIMFKLLEQLQVYGLVVIEGVPTDPTDNEDCWLRKVMGYIGEIRNTFYGETWNVKSVKQSKNVAYTDLDLGLHMDLLYFSSPPRFQALHCLRNRVNGGMSYFVDSFKVAFDLPMNIFNILTQHKIPYIYNNDNHFLRFRHPVLSPGLSLANPHSAVNWSPPFRDIGQTSSPPEAFDDSMSSRIRGFRFAALQEQKVYDAIAEFEQRLAEEHYKHSFTMKEGDLVLFDNRRVLHARTAFHDKTDAEREKEGIQLIEGEPTRWLKGCYLDGEVVWDKLAVLKKQVDAQDRKSDYEARQSEIEAKRMEKEARKVEKEAKKVNEILDKYAEPGTMTEPASR
ncbi:hypothetical protein IAU59_001351 [Kwoniella sp. CBS 9459]